MTTWIRHRAAILLFSLLAISAVAGGVWHYGYGQALDQLQRRGEADLALASDRLTAQLQRYQELAVFLAEHPELLALAEGRGDAAAAQALLLEAADKTTALDLIYADTEGTVLASARAADVTQTSVAGAQHFERALHGALGAHHAVDDTYGTRAFYFAAPTFGADRKVRGALVVVVDVVVVEENWRGDGPAVVFSDEGGLVFISNRSELLFWSREAGEVGLRPPEGDAPPFSSYWRSGFEIWRLNWGPYLPERGLHIVQDLPVIDMLGEAIVDVAPARRLAGLQAGFVAAVALAFGLILWLAMERRRVLSEANVELEARVDARTKALRQTNAALRREVVEREEAEAALKQAQADLVQAGKLSALGQMSAGISHELNQPLMAIQTFADNGERFLARGNAEKAGENLGRIGQMATRMARIIKNLRAFARNESEPMGKVDLVSVIDQAVELTGSRLRQDGVTLGWSGGAPVYALGGEVRLGQVFVNLINNAADAMADRADKHIEIVLATEPRLAVQVMDSGPGIDEPDRIFDPFYTTKEVGSSEGMGLGLSISYGLVQSFGGNIRGANRPEGGAVFTVELDRWEETEESAA
ncbi:two-component system C4-dicarboxylate transport sensor histidine kinase DctB [Shimia isoporae]|uniref:C4-dicarboxylate transport sensor protein DctB n=1 Tax=Shimia isoporae TaxID=647720 RepID=A0A4V2Q485_9RHOB|nr:ATP-binding protein [Shimia isoporae]TCL09780.1 two-component system C4-dicarboxylate transport sensor histidine kinase DctB [Shimia isoporae]